MSWNNYHIVINELDKFNVAYDSLENIEQFNVSWQLSWSYSKIVVTLDTTWAIKLERPLTVEEYDLQII